MMMKHMTFSHKAINAFRLCMLALIANVADMAYADDSNAVHQPNAVDLGLSVKWADCNLGGSAPLSDGQFYSFGEVKPKNFNRFIQDEYLIDENLSNQRFLSMESLVDKITDPVTSSNRELKADFDAGMANLGEGWRIPTAEEWNELNTKCKFKVEKENGVTYIKVTGPNGNHIVFTLSGASRSNERDRSSSVKGRNKSGLYWTSSAPGSKASVFEFTNYGRSFTHTLSPWNGCNIRPVYGAKNSGAVKNAAPEIAWVEAVPATTDSKYITVKIGIKSASSITSSNFYINGQQTRGIRTVNNDGYDLLLTQSLQLADGTNTLRVSVSNKYGTNTSERHISYSPDAVPAVVNNQGSNLIASGKSTVLKQETVQSTDKPRVDWVGVPQETGNKNLPVKIGIKSPSAILATAFYINGQLTRGVKSVGNDGYDLILSPGVQLVEGINSMRVEVESALGKTVSVKSVVYYPDGVDNNDNPITSTNAVNYFGQPQQKRIALVIGNSAYPGNELTNPVNDATDLSLKLHSLGFEVMLSLDATRREIDDKVSEFARKAAACDVAMFYFAGHGIQYNGSNYLIPVDATLRTARDIDFETANCDRILAYMEDSGCKVNIISLDACRNNPFERGWTRALGTRGFSAMNAPVGTIISYATSPGKVASDGNEQRNSPYTSALLRELDTPDLPIEAVFKRVASNVYEETDHQQTPWYASSLFHGDFIFNDSNQKR